MSDHDLSAAYLRLRALIPGAYDTPNAPTPEQVWEVTEAALRRLLQERVAARQGERELCAREIEARACHTRDHGQKTPEGLLTALAGAQLDALLDAAAALRNGDRPREYEAPRDPAEQLKLRGVGRVTDEPRALLVLLSERPTDDEIRSLRDYLMGWPLRNGSLLAGTNPGDTPAQTGGTL